MGVEVWNKTRGSADRLILELKPGRLSKAFDLSREKGETPSQGKDRTLNRGLPLQSNTGD